MLKGIILNRYKRTLPGGKTQEGLMIGDAGAAPAGTAVPVEGYLFSTVNGQTSPTLLFGTFTGTSTAANASLALTTQLLQVDAVPLEIHPLGGPDLFADRYRQYSAYVSDFNGWQDVQSVQLLINDTPVENRILARYDAVKNRFTLYNKATKAWVGSCAPGAAATIRTPWVSLSCKDSGVNNAGAGGLFTVVFSLKPTAKMLPPLAANAYVKAMDRAGLVAGWRMIQSGQHIAPIGP